MSNKVYESLHSVDDRSGFGEVTTPPELINEMLDKLPPDTWTDETKTFLDPCFGNGTILIEIIKRLRSHGHSMENIESRVSGYEVSLRLFNKVQKLLSHYNFSILYNNDFLNTSTEMKFDVIIGNPPYSKVKNERVRLWSKFIDRSFEIMNDDSLLLFVTPSSWLSSTNYSYSVLKDRLSYINLSKEVSDSFGKVGGTQRFIYFVANKNIVNSCTTTYDEGDSLINPMGTPFNPIKSSSKYMFSIVDKIYNSNFPTHNWKRVDKEDLSAAVIVPRAKSINHVVKFESVDPFGDITRFKLKTDKDIGEKIANNLNLKVYKQLRWDMRSGAAIANNFYKLPIPSKQLTDSELYAELGLTEEEIAYAESL